MLGFCISQKYPLPFWKRAILLAGGLRILRPQSLIWPIDGAYKHLRRPQMAAPH